MKPAHITRVRAVSSLLQSDGVERGPTGAPTAFRIWKSGANPTDKGVHCFTARSAKLLLAEQATRGNLYSIDVDHLSVDNPRAPPEARKAVGWHTLATRDGPDGPELWATNVEWTEAVRSGLTSSPPEWRYFSPAYNVHTESGEIVSYLNTALTNNPATWSVTALATSTALRDPMGMTASEMLVALCGDDEKKKAEAMTLLKAAFPDDKDDKDEKDEGEPPPDSTKGETTKKAAEEPKEPKKKEGDDEDSKAAVAAVRELASTVAAQTTELAELRAERLAKDRAAILATRPDLPPTLVKTLEKLPLALMKETIAGVPAPAVDPAAAARVTATRGSSHGDGSEFGAVRAARLPPKEHEELAARMGRDAKPKGIHWDADHQNDLVFPQLTKADARAHLATRDQGPPKNPARSEGVK